MVTIKVPRDSGIIEKIRTARDAGQPVVFDDGEEVISISTTTTGPQEPKADIWANYDPDAMIAALRKSAGAFADIDTEQLKADIREQRDQDSSGRPA
jgi:hypothetical protein